MKSALYLRSSTHEQNSDAQRAELERLATAHGWDIAVYEDQISGAKASRAGRRLREITT